MPRQQKYKYFSKYLFYFYKNINYLLTTRLVVVTSLSA